MSVRSQAMHLSFVMLSRSTLVGRERHQTPWGRGRPHYFFLFGLGGFGAASGLHGGFCGSIWVFDAAVASVASDAAEGAPVAVCDSASVAMPDAMGPSGEEEHVFDSGH